MHIQFIFIVKNELVAENGNALPGALGVNTLNVAQQSSNFSKRKTLLVTLSVGLLLIGIAIGVLPDEQVYKVTGLVLQKFVQLCPKYPLSQVSRQLSF